MPYTIGQMVRVAKFYGAVAEFRGYSVITGFCTVRLAGETHPTTVRTDDIIEIPKPAKMPAWLTED